MNHIYGPKPPCELTAFVAIAATNQDYVSAAFTPTTSRSSNVDSHEVQVGETKSKAVRRPVKFALSMTLPLTA